MTQLEQLRIIVVKEIKTKQWMADQESSNPKSSYYWQGAIAGLSYIKHVIDRLIKDDDIAQTNGKSE